MVSMRGLPGFILSLVVIAMIGGVGVIVVSEFKDIAIDKNYTSAADFINYALNGFTTIGTFLGVIVIAAVGYIVISIVAGGAQGE